jgi:hypothetical protein
MRTTGLLLVGAAWASATSAQQLFELPAGVKTRWYSFENPTGGRGEGGRSNDGRKGAAFRRIAASETVTLADIPGPGVVRRIWCTVRGEPEFLRGLVIRIFWDDVAQAAVEAPLQDFFGVPFGRQARFESALFSSPEGRSFVSAVPMPFRKHARIAIENQSPREAMFFYDVDATLGDALPADLAYFHARYRRENPTTPGRDFEILPRLEARGRYLGANVGVRSLAPYGAPLWFGEGELKLYLDDDKETPTLVGTGTEDMVGSGWGLARFDHLYQGSLLTEPQDGVWGFYRYHVPDPVFFQKGARVVLQQMAGATVAQLRALPVDRRPQLVRTHRVFDPGDYRSPEQDEKWENFEVAQDVCATAYWYQTLPSPALPPIAPYAERIRDLNLPPPPPKN